MKLSRKAVREGLDTVPMETLLLGITNPTGVTLSAKDREFARQIALGESKAGAFRKSRKSKGKPESQSRRGQEIAKKSAVQSQIEAFKVAMEAQRLATPAHLRALVVQQLTEKALDPDVGHSQQIRALELLGKITEVSLFTERREIVHTKPAEEIREKLLESIRAAIKNGAEDAEVKDADSLLNEIREPNLVSDNVTDDSHLSSDKVTTWEEGDQPGEGASIDGGECAADGEEDTARQSMAGDNAPGECQVEEGATGCENAGDAHPPAGDPPMRG